MEYIKIDVPDLNDSISRIVLSGKEYQIRFSYNDMGKYWKFSLYSSLNEIIVQGIKIVPSFPLNLFYGVSKIPTGFFGVITKLSSVGRNDFVNGNATFIFCPVEMQ